MSEYYAVERSDTFEHHGVKGMRWGVRRYRNSDGSYTNEGKKRYISDKTRKIDRDIHSYDPYMKSGIKTRRGKTLLSVDEVRAQRKALEAIKANREEKYSAKWDKAVKKQAKRKKNSWMTDEYKKGLQRATLEGGLIGRAIYKKKNKPAAQPSVKKETKQVSHYTKDGKMKTHNTDSGITRQVKKDWNNLGDREFKQKYYTSKKTYAKRVEKYGDPYKHRTGNTDAAKAKTKKELALDAEWKKKRGK